MATNFAHYRKGDIKNVKPGYKNEVYFSASSAFTKIAEPLLAGIGAAKHTITEDHTFALGGGFFVGYLLKKKNTASAEMKGDAGAAYLLFKATLVIPGDGPVLQSLIEELINEDLIILQKDANCPEGAVVQYGCDCGGSSVTSVKFDAGTLGGDSGKAWTIEIEATCRDFYEGTIPIKA
jgi:hypothetical protein